MEKWKLMLTTLPYVAVVLTIKLLLDRSGFAGAIEFGDVGLVLSGGVFLVGFMLAGTMSDYKESERLPSELACSLETLEETLVGAAHAKPQLDEAASRRAVLNLTDNILGWLYHKTKADAVFAELTSVSEYLRKVESAGAGGYAVRGLNELNGLRKVVSRIHVISRTNFLSIGYALLQALTAVILTLMVLAKYKSTLAEIVLVSFVTLIFVYMLRLIRDIDDPFEYSSDGIKGAAEVDLFPLTEYRGRIAARTTGAVTSTTYDAKLTA